MENYVSTITGLIEKCNPLLAKKLARFLPLYDDLFYQRANRFFAQYERVLKHLGKDFSYSVECYDQMLSEMSFERINFLDTGKYSNISFDDVRQKLYENPEAFEHHMHGLALAQFIWWDQYQRFSFYADNLSTYINGTTRYLEIGGGHGLYISEALEQLKSVSVFDMVDISPTSIEMSKIALNTKKINYILSDIYDYTPPYKYDFITIGEVIEHLEDPKSLMIKLGDMLADNGVIFVTTPANAPMIDHIYLFNNKEEIRDFLMSSGFRVKNERAVFAENIEEKEALIEKVPLMYAAFIEKNL